MGKANLSSQLNLQDLKTFNCNYIYQETVQVDCFIQLIYAGVETYPVQYGSINHVVMMESLKCGWAELRSVVVVKYKLEYEDFSKRENFH